MGFYIVLALALAVAIFILWAILAERPSEADKYRAGHPWKSHNSHEVDID